MAKKESARIVHGYIKIKSNNDNEEGCSITDPTVTEFAMGMFSPAGFSGWLYIADGDRWNEVYISNDCPQQTDRSTLDSMNMDSFFDRALRSEFDRLIRVPYDRETDRELPYIACNASDFEGDTILYLSDESKNMSFPMDEVKAKFIEDNNKKALKNAFMEKHFCQDDNGLVPDYDAYISGASDGQICEASEGLSRYDLEIEYKEYSRNRLVPDALKIERLSLFIKNRFEAVNDKQIEQIVQGEML